MGASPGSYGWIYVDLTAMELTTGGFQPLEDNWCFGGHPQRY